MKYTYDEIAAMRQASAAFANRADATRARCLKEADEELSGFVKRLLHKTEDSELYDTLEQEFEDGLPPADIVERHLSGLFNGIIFPRRRACVLYAARHCTRWPYAQSGLERRSFRTADTSAHFPGLMQLLTHFITHDRVDRDVADILHGRVSEEERSYLIGHDVSLHPLQIACEIDSGNEEVIRRVKDALSGEAGADPNHALILGVFQSSHAELHELMGRLLLAARLQEGLRQAICEAADMGCLSAFRGILRVIHEHHLIRFSSVKRALGVWAGIMAHPCEMRRSDLERISGKTGELMVQLLEDAPRRRDALRSEDSMAIHLALWASGVHEVEDMLAGIAELAKTGSPHQLLTAGYSAQQLCEKDFQHAVASYVWRQQPGQDVLAMFMPSFMPGVGGELHELARRARRSQGRSEDALDAFFETQEEAELHYDFLLATLRSIRGKAVEFTPCVFPWHRAELSRMDIVLRLAWIAAALGDDARVDEVLDYLDDADYYRDTLIEALLPCPRTEKQKRVLVERLGDKREDARKSAYALVCRMELSAEHYAQLESMLRYKNADIRSKLITQLLRQQDAPLLACVERLLADKKEEKRSAALDIILRLGKAEERQALYAQCCRLAAQCYFSGTPPNLLMEYSRGDDTNGRPQGTNRRFSTTKEKLLAAQLLPVGGQEAEEEAPLYGESDSYSPVLDAAYMKQAEATFRKYFYHRSALEKLRGKPHDFEPFLERLSRLMQEHAADEFLNFWGEKTTLSNSRIHLDCPEEGEATILFSDVWDAFHAAEAPSPMLVLRALVAVVSEGEVDDYATQCAAYVRKLLGGEFTPARPVANVENLVEVCLYYLARYGNREEQTQLAAHLASRLMEEPELGIRHKYRGGRVGVLSLARCHQFKLLLGPLSDMKGEAIHPLFPLCYQLEHTPGYRTSGKDYVHSRSESFYLSLPSCPRLEARDYIRAAHCGIISEGFLFRTLLDSLHEKATEPDPLDALRHLSCLAMGGQEARALAAEPGLPEFTQRVGERLIATILHTELRRGDEQTRFSQHIFQLRHIRGAVYYVRILAALGREPLCRVERRNDEKDCPRGECLSHLLKICVPAPGDSAATLADLLRGTDIREERLLEAAMYSPAWLSLTEEYLGWPGLESACLYFMAHTSEEFDDKRAARLARHTPLSPEELNNGAFDLNWFRSAHAALGHKRFELVYKAARYISDGARHTRARKYADAASGKLSPAETQANVAGKRNKDLLMAYALIPLADEADLLTRYLYLRQFLRESRQYGAQRQTSEKLAVDMALRNLATNAGFADVTRMSLRLETQLLESLRPLLEDTPLGDVSVRLIIPESGRADILCTKGGKALKSIPARLKKDAHLLLLTETKKRLLDQHARTRLMLEQAMEDGTEYSFGELADLMANPVVAPLLRHLVCTDGEHSGYLGEGGLLACDGSGHPLSRDASLRIAHPIDLHKQHCWAAFQQDVFARGIVQPFRQVFRELYVRTPEELPTSASRRYAGHQVQPRKALACLRNRRWVADDEEGLQKVCYRENIVVRLCARADWFSPSDIEAPALEWVDFSDRRTGNPIPIRDVPERLFSEIMRDVDLAVSVAHVGGVDPETSHSTVEMRAALLRFTLPLFRLNNVDIIGSHAHITGTRADYTLHLGSGVVHQKGGSMLSILPVHSQQRGRLFLPFADDDPRTAEILSKVLLLAEDANLKDPTILAQLNQI